jgi:hypothetical protein
MISAKSEVVSRNGSARFASYFCVLAADRLAHANHAAEDVSALTQHGDDDSITHDARARRLERGVRRLLCGLTVDVFLPRGQVRSATVRIPNSTSRIPPDIIKIPYPRKYLESHGKTFVCVGALLN